MAEEAVEIVEYVGKQKIVKYQGKYFVHDPEVGYWGFYLATLQAARNTAKQFA